MKKLILILAATAFVATASAHCGKCDTDKSAHKCSEACKDKCQAKEGHKCTDACKDKCSKKTDEKK